MKKSLLNQRTTLQFFSILGLMLLFSTLSWGQTTVFNETFGTVAVANPFTGGTSTPSKSYTKVSTASTPGTASIVGTGASSYLALTGATFAGRTYLTATLPTTDYNSILNANVGVVTWTFNMRMNRTTNIDGLTNASASNVVPAYILVSNNSDLLSTTTKGYAVSIAIGSAAGTHKIQLHSFTEGLALGGALPAVILSTADFTAQEYMSIKVTYNPATNVWTLAAKTNGLTTSFTDPATDTYATTLTANNSVNTAIAMSHFGYFYQHGTANTTARFDNYKVVVDPPSTTPLIISAQSSISGFAYVQGNGPSSVQSSVISGTNLGAGASIFANLPTSYEISKDNFATAAATADLDLGTGGTLSVRLKAGLTSSTYPENIVLRSTGATNVSIPCSGSVTASEPTAQVTNLTFSSNSSTGFTVNWTSASSGGGTNHLVVIKAATDITSNPIDATTYTANAAFGTTGTALGGGYVVYNGTGNTVTVTGLSKGIRYHVRVYDFNGSAGTENYLVTAPTSSYQATVPGEITSAQSGPWGAASTWNGGVPTQGDNVTIGAGHIVDVASTSAKCYNLTIPATSTVWSPSGKTLQVYGTSLACEGTFGDASNTASILSIEFGENLTISGSGGIYPAKLKPVTGITNIGVTFDANVSLTATGTTLMFDNVGNNNMYYTVNSSRTLNIAGNFNTCSSSVTQSSSNNTLTINSGATVNLTGVLNTNEASGKTYTANINGTLAVTGTSTLSGTSGGGVATFNVNGNYTSGTSISSGNLLVTPIEAVVAPVINVGSSGVITVVNGTADFSNTSLTGYIGNAPSTTGGTFILGALGTIKFATPGGLEPVSGPIRTSTRNFNTGANYNFVGATAQVPGNDFPATVGNMTINNAAGVTLSSSKTVSTNLNLTSGVLTTGGYLTLANGATIVRSAGSLSAAPTFESTVNVSYGGTFTTQSGTTASSTNVTLTAANALIAVGMPVSGAGIAAGTTVSSISGTTLGLSIAATATSTGPVTLSFAYNTALTTSNEIPTLASVLSNLTINHPAGVTLASATNLNNKLTVTSGSLATAGYLTLKSAECCTAYVGQLATGAVTGLVTVERYIPAKRAWRALTAPVNTTTSIFTNWQEGGTGNTLNGFDIWMPNAATGSGLYSGGSSYSLLQYNSTGNTWTGISNTTDSSTMMNANGDRNKPFMAFVTGPYGTGNISAGFAATTLRAKGTLLIGDQTYPSGAGEYTFIGNPYASPLNLKTMLDDSANDAFDNNIWIWQAIGAGNVGVYNTYDPAASGAYTNATNTIDATTTQMQSGQAFFVKSTNAAMFTIKEIHKGTISSPSAGVVFRDAAPAQLLRVGLYKQTNTEWSGRDGAMTVILPDADANQTPNKMANGTENVAFTKNSGLFASNHHLPLVASDVLNVKVWNTTAGANYKLKINTEQFATTSLNATLEDLFTNSRTPLTLDGTAVEYPFAVTSEAASSGNRFRIVFENSALGINNPKATGISILPNPITGDTFQVNLGTLGIGTYSYSICNALGQEVEKGNINNTTLGTSYSVKFKNSTAAGMYIMKVTGEDNTVFSAKIIKQ